MLSLLPRRRPQGSPDSWWTVKSLDMTASRPAFIPDEASRKQSPTACPKKRAELNRACATRQPIKSGKSFARHHFRLRSAGPWLVERQGRKAARHRKPFGCLHWMCTAPAGPAHGNNGHPAILYIGKKYPVSTAAALRSLSPDLESGRLPRCANRIALCSLAAALDLAGGTGNKRLMRRQIRRDRRRSFAASCFGPCLPHGPWPACSGLR